MSQQEIEIEVRSAVNDDLQAAWPLYRDFIVENIFSIGRMGASMSNWDEDQELSNFSARWTSENCYVIEVDGQTVGWLSTSLSDKKLIVENIFLEEKWQNKGISTRIVSEMLPSWRDKKLSVEFPVLRDAALSPQVELTLTKLGFSLASEDELTRNFLINFQS